MAKFVEAITCCCKWRSHVREEEEKEKLMSREREQASETSEAAMPAGYLQLQKRRELVRKVARVGFQSRIQVQSRPLTVDEMETLLQNPATLHTEYLSIPNNLVTMADVPPGAEEKNRYKDILPNPQTRVALFLKFGEANSDYINANYVRGYRNASKAFIATQGPLPWTVNDFWRMVWEQKTSIVVMVTGLEEKRIMKCSQYWPDSQVSLTASFGELDVTLTRRTAQNNYTVTQYHLRHRERLVSRNITHFWFTAWPDHGVPTSTGPALQYLQHIRQTSRDIPGPIIVHCSAGIGRTGVFIGAHIGMSQMEEEGEIDILKIVSSMRQDRGGMVQTEQQYIFLYQLLLEYAKQFKGQKSSSDQTSPVPSRSHTIKESESENRSQDTVIPNNYTLFI